MRRTSTIESTASLVTINVSNDSPVSPRLVRPPISSTKVGCLSNYGGEEEADSHDLVPTTLRRSIRKTRKMAMHISSKSKQIVSCGKGRQGIAHSIKSKAYRHKTQDCMTVETARSSEGEVKVSKTSPWAKKSSLSPNSTEIFEAFNYGKTQKHVLCSLDLEQVAPCNQWIDLCVSPEELRPSNSLTTGQCFNWITVNTNISSDNFLVCAMDGDDRARTNKLSTALPSQQKESAWGTHNATEWVGPIGCRVVSIRETPNTTLCRVLHGSSSGFEQDMRKYFQLDTPLAPLYDHWSQNDPRMAILSKVIPGVRVLRQDPVECLFSFICSSNNNIPRITLMMSRLKERYGSLLIELPRQALISEADDVSLQRNLEQKSLAPPLQVFSFPTIESLSAATESDFRAMGLGYRAKYIVETCNYLQGIGGKEHLFKLRQCDDADVVQSELLKCPGIGRKVADCIALFSLDQIGAIPVDVHVRNIASRDYDASLVDGAKSLTPTIYRQVGELFKSRFGPWAGWAHSLLFVAELPSFRSVLPVDLLSDMDKVRSADVASCHVRERVDR